VRLVRDYGRANRFITAGGASALLALPGASAFEGSTALLAVVFRHLLEDPVTLQAAMETEIRAAFTRISRPAGNQQGGASAGVNGNRDNPPAVRLITLMSVLRPLLVRDGRLLVQAAANVLRRVENPGGAATGDNGGNVFVALATANKHGTAQAAGDKDKSTGVVHQAANPTEGQPSAAAAVAHPTVQSRTPTSQRAAAAAVGGAGAGAAGVEGGSGSSRSERLESHGRT
ncbi:unnamed protein product, partial [Sphacelaria rigidula]